MANSEKIDFRIDWNKQFGTLTSGMTGRFLLLFGIAGLTATQSFAADTSLPDRIEIRGGAVLLGHIESVGERELNLQTGYAGLVTVDLDQVERLVLGTTREIELPEHLADKPAPLAARAAPVTPARKSHSEPGRLPGWKVEGGMDLNGNTGNTDRFNLTLTLQAELEREFDRLKLYGRYAYGTNRGVRSANEIIGGARYNNYVFDRVGFFLREEFEQDDFEGIYIRSTSAAGLIFEFSNEKRLRVEARTGLSYRFEDYTDDGADDFPGMDFGLDVNWQFIQWARFKGTYSFLPSIRDFEDFIFEQDSGFNLPLNQTEQWKLRFGISSQYNNQPDFGREKVDTRYYARLIASWN
ncbi:DUF481 domain-containing protein [Puniceicoccales bacterium CK1056]|uniref:DUF481 domain-containing protein n=1 Tax=Oceanipulchritudo coccoides TaxID=2706888 RepID=A0A6B2LYL4_9BACT|nr:DUF481 domain-containing protein [Oceanipulchritudo coccoides]NDV61136.1 DUF481 domain-containing protein [Oceanipulchritudo coccoides]